jgi:hypothetical protein
MKTPVRRLLRAARFVMLRIRHEFDSSGSRLMPARRNSNAFSWRFLMLVVPVLLFVAAQYALMEIRGRRVPRFLGRPRSYQPSLTVSWPARVVKDVSVSRFIE